MRSRRPLIRSALAALTIATCLSIAGAASSGAVEWKAPIAVKGVRHAAIDRVAVSRNDAVAIAAVHEFTGIVAVRYPEGRWIAPRRIGDARTPISSVDVAFDARGRLLVVWNQAKRVGGKGLTYVGPNEVMAQTWTERKGWGAVKPLGPSKSFILGQPRLAVDRRGDAIAYWRGYRRSHGRSVDALSSSYRTADHGWQAMQQTSSGGPFRDMRLDAQGNAYAVWTSPYNRNYFALRPRRQARWGQAKPLPGHPASVPKIAVTPNGTAVIAWRAAVSDNEGDGIQYGLLRAIVRSPSGRWSKVRSLGGGLTHEALLAVSPTTGRVLLTWAPPPYYGASPDIHFSLFSPATGFSAALQATGVSGGPIAYRRTGEAITVFGSGLELRGSALVSREPNFSEAVTMFTNAARPSLATPPNSAGPVQAAVAFSRPSDGNAYLSLLERGPHEPAP